MTGWEVAAIIAPITTLAGALGGAWLTLRYERGREIRDARRSAYNRWMQLSENLPKLSIEPGVSPIQELNDRKAELELLGSRKVRRTVQDHMKAFIPVGEQIQATIQQLSPRATEAEKLVAIRGFFRALDAQKEQVLAAMRKDLGIRD